MELPFLVKLRIAVSLAAGVVLIGILGWPMVGSSDGISIVSFVGGAITNSNAVVITVLAFAIGLVMYFICWPYGSQIGVLSVPAGLCVWGMRSDSMGTLMQMNPALEQRLLVFSVLKWEPLFWLGVCMAGFLGVLVGKLVSGNKFVVEIGKEQKGFSSNKFANMGIFLLVSGIVCYILIRLLAQDVRLDDAELGSVVGQPEKGQIVFAVFAAFFGAGFVVKKFFGGSYMWPVVISGLLTGVSVLIYVNQGSMGRLCEHFPAVFFISPILAILPIQMVSLGILGAICGFWSAVRYSNWSEQRTE